MFRRIEIATPYGSLGASWVACDAMCASGLPNPHKKSWRQIHRHAKFFFTEYGWQLSGHAVLSKIRSLGLHAKIITVKERDPRINLIYRDKWQAAIAFGGRHETSRHAERFAQ